MSYIIPKYKNILLENLDKTDLFDSHILPPLNARIHTCTHV